MLKKLEKIVAVTKIQPPFTYPCVLDPNQLKECRRPGINFDIFRILMTILGFDYEIIEAERKTTGHKDTNGEWFGMLAQLDRGDANMTATVVAVRNDRLEIADFSSPVSYYISGFIVKARENVNVMELPLQFLSSPFSKQQWLYLLASMILVACVYIISTRFLLRTLSLKMIDNCSYTVMRSVMSQTYVLDKFLTPRILFSFFEIALFFIISFYCAFLTSSLLVSVKTKDPFTGYDEFARLIYDNKYTLITDDDPEKHIPITDKQFSSEPGEMIRIAYQWNPPVFVPTNNYKQLVDKIIQNESLVYYGSYYHLLHATSTSCDVKVIVDTYTYPIWLAFAFPKGSKLQDLISSALHRDDTTVDTFLSRLYQRYSKRRNCFTQNIQYGPARYKEFGLWEMQGAFFVLLIGSGAAILIVIFEYLLKGQWIRNQGKKSPVTIIKPDRQEEK